MTRVPRRNRKRRMAWVSDRWVFVLSIMFPKRDRVRPGDGSQAHSTHGDIGLSGEPSLSHREDGAMARSGDDAYWRDLESHAHLPEVQEIIREEIKKGTIRVRPNPDGSIRIVPVRPAESGSRGDRT